MSQNIIEAKTKTLPIGTILTFNNSSINPADSYLGTWELLSNKNDILYYNSIQVSGEISNSTATSKTCIAGVYNDGDHWITKTFLNGCPSGYTSKLRIRAYGYTTSGGYISVYFNNIVLNLGSWGPTTYTKDSTSSWVSINSITPEENAYNLSNSTYGGYNVYYQAVNTTSNWKIYYINIDLAYISNNIEYKWLRKA